MSSSTATSRAGRRRRDRPGRRPDDRFVTIGPRGQIAADATGEQRTRLWEAQKRDAPQFAEYEANTDRTIPVVVLSRH